MKINDNGKGEEGEVLQRMKILTQDMAVLERRKERIERDRQILVLKLIAQREQLLALKEQDE